MAERIAMLGAGSWGMATANLLAENGHEVTLWEFDRTEYQKLVEDRSIPEKLKNFVLPESIRITHDLNTALDDVTLIVLAVPSQVLRAVVSKIDNLPLDVGIVHLSKGIEISSLKRMSEVISEELHTATIDIAALSGPSHAEEVIRRMPTAVVAAGASESFVQRVQSVFSNSYFRVYDSPDLIGVELGGALKNIVAIAAGIADGLKMGDNTRGAILTRGLAEITRLGTAMGAQPDTFAGLSGIGDLITTCTSGHSRNRHVGLSIGRGATLEEVLAGMVMVAEGVQTARSGFELACRHDVEMPITTQVYKVLFEDKPAQQAVSELMSRKLKSEIWQ